MYRDAELAMLLIKENCVKWNELNGVLLWMISRHQI
jgi:hypothetical protein